VLFSCSIVFDAVSSLAGVSQVVNPNA
jgi:hypothetical protein